MSVKERSIPRNDASLFSRNRRCDSGFNQAPRFAPRVAPKVARKVARPQTPVVPAAREPHIGLSLAFKREADIWSKLLQLRAPSKLPFFRKAKSLNDGREGREDLGKSLLCPTSYVRIVGPTKRAYPL